MRGLMLDLTPLRGREFRLLFLGQLISSLGSMITFVALPFQLYEETGSTLAVGALGICEFHRDRHGCACQRRARRRPRPQAARARLRARVGRGDGRAGRQLDAGRAPPLGPLRLRHAAGGLLCAAAPAARRARAAGRAASADQGGDGLRYARSRPELLGTYLVDINAMFFGIPEALFPALAVGYGGAEVLGLLLAAPAAGSQLVALFSGWTRHVHRHGRAVALAASGWGLAIIGFGFSDALWLALLFLAVAGGMDAVSGLFRSVMWNETIPDRLRGRLAGVEMISYTSGPTLGNFEAGAVASFAGVRTSIVSGGVMCVVGTVALVAALPALWRYDARHRVEA